MRYVSERIAIGNLDDANNLFMLRENGITGVLNLAWQWDVVFRNVGYGDQFPVEYMKVGLTDGDSDTALVMCAAVSAALDMLRRNEKLLIHCHAGRSRSVTVAAVVLSMTGDTEFSAALDRCKSPKGDPAPGVIQAAIDFLADPVSKNMGRMYRRLS